MPDKKRPEVKKIETSTAVDLACTFRNFCVSGMYFLGPSAPRGWNYNDRVAQKESKSREILEVYHASRDLGEKEFQGKLSSMVGNYESNAESWADALIKAGGTDLKLTDAHKENVLEQIKAALKAEPNDDARRVKAEYNRIPKIIEETVAPASAVTKILHEVRKDDDDALKNHADASRAKLEDLFSNLKFQKKILGIDPPDDLTPLLAEQSKTLEGIKTNLLKEFDQKTADIRKQSDQQIQNAHNMVAKRNREIVALYWLYEYNKKIIAQRIAVLDRGLEDATLAVDVSDENTDFKGVTLEKLHLEGSKFKLPSGHSCIMGENSISMTLPTLSNPFYINNPNNPMLDDFFFMAMYNRAKFDTIEMNFNHQTANDAHKEFVLLNMYEACRKAGYKPNEITLTLNGTKIEANLLKKIESQYDQKCSQDDKVYSAQEQEFDTSKYAEMKIKLDGIKKEPLSPPDPVPVHDDAARRPGPE